jgi:D-amino-acid dehydrogenase
MTTRRDVIVVGGGSLGLCTAWYLLKAGRKVTVLTRDPVGVGASVGNAGMLVPSHVVPLASPGVIAQGIRWLARRDSPFHIKPRLDLNLIRWLLRFRASATAAHVAFAAPHLRDLSLASLEAFDELKTELDDFALSRTGLMMVYRTEDGYRANMQAADVAEKLGLLVRRLTGPEVLEQEPALRSAHTGAVLYPQDGRVNPDAFIRALGAAIRKAGGEILEGVEVEAVKNRRVDCRTGSWSGSDVVVAAGAWTQQLAPGIPVQPAKGYSISQDCEPGGLTMPMILSEEKVTITPLPGRIRFGGTLSLSGLDASIDQRRLAPILAQADLYRESPTTPREQTWSGFRPCSPDGLPILGAMPGEPGCWIASGHGMMGLSLGPGSGQLMAGLITGKVPAAKATAFSPGRFSGKAGRTVS